MKKVLLFVAVISAASFASCKKDRTCTCTTTGSTTEQVYTLTKIRKGDAKDACNNHTYTDASGSSTTTCTLK